MRSTIAASVLLGLVFVPACSDDTNQPPASDNSISDKVVVTGEGSLPWPDQAVQKDTAAGKCTPGQPGMCDDNKNYYCAAGVCTACPVGRKDCDRKDTCECAGSCDGVKCVKPGG